MKSEQKFEDDSCAKVSRSHDKWNFAFEIKSVNFTSEITAATSSCIAPSIFQEVGIKLMQFGHPLHNCAAVVVATVGR
jgi:hypothetical protein